MSENYNPNADSIARFKSQFEWELQLDEVSSGGRKHPHWAWGHAVDQGYHLAKVSERVPKDYELA